MPTPGDAATEQWSLTNVQRTEAQQSRSKEAEAGKGSESGGATRLPGQTREQQQHIARQSEELSELAASLLCSLAMPRERDMVTISDKRGNASCRAAVRHACDTRADPTPMQMHQKNWILP